MQHWFKHKELEVIKLHHIPYFFFKPQIMFISKT
jgi:hypothetical protein